MAEKGKRTGSRRSKDGGIISTAVEQVSRAATETTRIAGEVLDSATSAANTARETGAEWVKGVSPTAADVLRPGGRKQKAGGRAARQPRKTAAGKAAAGEVRQANKAVKRAGKTAASATRAATRTAGRVASGARKAARAATTGGRKGGAKKR
jgi:hypothetical protein